MEHSKPKDQKSLPIEERIKQAIDRVSRLTTEERRQLLIDAFRRVGPPDETWPQVIGGVDPEELLVEQERVRKERSADQEP